MAKVKAVKEAIEDEDVDNKEEKDEDLEHPVLAAVALNRMTDDDQHSNVLQPRPDSPVTSHISQLEKQYAVQEKHIQLLEEHNRQMEKSIELQKMREEKYIQSADEIYKVGKNEPIYAPIRRDFEPQIYDPSDVYAERRQKMFAKAPVLVEKAPSEHLQVHY